MVKEGRNNFDRKIEEVTGKNLHGLDIENIQVNLGLKCNQMCTHCHVSASPDRTEIMSWPTMEKVVETIKILKIRRIDLTGGAPELNPHFRRFVTLLREAGYQAQVRTNLTVLHEPGMENMPEFFRNNQVGLVASLPCYLEENVNAQRGSDTYMKSIEALKRLNAVGYGIEPNLPLNLVYNPSGRFLPPKQTALERDYKRELTSRFGIMFSRLLTITNMPIGRYGNTLQKYSTEGQYINLLEDSFNPDTIERLMCRRQISVNWEGIIYDCDFNLALGMSVNSGIPNRMEKITEYSLLKLKDRKIATGTHCFGCTAGGGSSCGGTLT